jgi:ArsR family transcriptional regulator
MKKPLEAMAAGFQALGDPTRLRILGLLLTGEVCVCHIHESLRIPQPKASRHLAYLRRAGWSIPAATACGCTYRFAESGDRVERTIRQAITRALGDIETVRRDTGRLQKKTGAGLRFVADFSTSGCGPTAAPAQGLPRSTQRSFEDPSDCGARRHEPRWIDRIASQQHEAEARQRDRQRRSECREPSCVTAAIIASDATFTPSSTAPRLLNASDRAPAVRCADERRKRRCPWRPRRRRAAEEISDKRRCREQRTRRHLSDRYCVQLTLGEPSEAL